jgi:hypothetical protein
LYPSATHVFGHRANLELAEPVISDRIDNRTPTSPVRDGGRRAPGRLTDQGATHSGVRVDRARSNQTLSSVARGAADISSGRPTVRLMAVDLVTTSWVYASWLLPPVRRARHTLCGGMRPLRRRTRPQALAPTHALTSAARQPPPRAMASRHARSRSEGSSAHHQVSCIHRSRRSRSLSTSALAETSTEAR